MRRALLVVLLAVVALWQVAEAITLSGGSVSGAAVGGSAPGGGEGGGTAYSNPALNVFDTMLDEAQSDALIAANGILWVDGFEDGMAFDAANGGCTQSVGSIPAGNDGWAFDAAYITGGGADAWWYDCADYGVNANFNFAQYRASATTIDTTIGNYGVAGSRGVMDLLWRGTRANTGEVGSRYQTKMAAGWHHISIENGDPLDQLSTNGPTHYYASYYVSIKSDQSMMCDCNQAGGWDCPTDALPTAGPCPLLDIASDAANGVKGWETIRDLYFGPGIMGGIMGRDFYDTPDSTGWGLTCQDTFLDVGDDENRHHFSQRQNQGVDVRTNQIGNGNHKKWWRVQAEIQQSSSPTANDGYVRLWIDDCGLDGLGCIRGNAPTLRAYYTGLDNYYDDSPSGTCNVRRGLKTVWWNWWEGTNTWGNFNGGYQFDEIAFANGAVRGANNPIGFVTNISGLSVTP